MNRQKVMHLGSLRPRPELTPLVLLYLYALLYNLLLKIMPRHQWNKTSQINHKINIDSIKVVLLRKKWSQNGSTSRVTLWYIAQACPWHTIRKNGSNPKWLQDETVLTPLFYQCKGTAQRQSSRKSQYVTPKLASS